ncbi:MAG TPA: hypothetical protein VGD68_16885, partial [Streptosporangiaceae bacterium]
MGDPAAVMLTGLRALGPYFAVGSHDPGSPVTAPWRPLSDLLGSSAALGERAGQVRAALARAGGLAPGQVEFRAAASVSHLGLAARLFAPAFGAALLGRRVLPFDPDQARWVPAEGSLFPLSVPGTDLEGAGDRDALALSVGLTRRWLDGA